jgi:hypothetical protein
MKNEKFSNIIDRFLILGLDSNEITSRLNSAKPTTNTISNNIKILEEYKSTYLKDPPDENYTENITSVISY